MKRFHLIRDKDYTGVSGTGVVAEGAQFSNGQAVLCWKSDTSSIVVYKCIEDCEKIHNHIGTANEGGTRIEFLD